MRNAALIVVLVIVLALGAGTGWYWWTAWRFQESTDDAYVQSDITVISPKVEGYLKEVRVEENQQVAAGQVLYRRRRPRLRRQDRAGRGGGRDRGGGRSQPMRAGSTMQQAMIEQAAATVQSAEADLDRAQTRLQALCDAGHQRFRQPAALRDGAGRFAQGRGRPRQGARGAGRRADPARRAAVAKTGGRGASRAGARQPAARPQRSRQHGHPRAGRRDRRQPRRPGRPIRQARDAAPVAGAAAQCLRHRQFQGDPADPYAAGPEAPKSRSTPIPISRSPAASRASHRRAGPSSACCRRTTRPGISPRSCSACRCASRCRRTGRSPGCCGPAFRSR